MRLRFWKKFKIIEVEGSSMHPRIQNGWYLLFREINQRVLKRGDIILYKHDSKWLIKRILGLPEELIEIQDEKLYINGESINEEYLVKPRISAKITKWNLNQGDYVILGDNSSDSIDSRRLGSVTFPENVYRFSKRIWPWRVV